MEPISIHPLAIAPPQEAEVVSSEIIQSMGNDGHSRLSDWVNGRLKAFGELVGAAYEGYEGVVIVILVSIESQRNQNKLETSEQCKKKK
jgi:hypothetical protein